MIENLWSGRIILGTVLGSTGVQFDDILAICHTFTSDGLTGGRCPVP